MPDKNDISSEQRAEYKAKIMRKERDLEDFQKLRKSLGQSDVSYIDTLNSGYGNLRELQERDRRWDRTLDKEISLDSRKASEVDKLVHEQNARVEEYFAQIKKQTLNKIEELEKERRDLPWD